MDSRIELPDFLDRLKVYLEYTFLHYKPFLKFFMGHNLLDDYLFLFFPLLRRWIRNMIRNLHLSC